MIQIDGQQLEKAILAHSLHSVACVIGVGPRIGAGRQTTICQQIQHTFVRIQLRAQEY